MSDQKHAQPSDREPTRERQAELRARVAANISAGKRPFTGVVTHARDDIDWIIGQMARGNLPLDIGWVVRTELQTMSRPVQIALFEAIGQILIATILLATLSLPVPLLALDIGQAHPLLVPVHIVVVGAVFLVLALSYVFAGAFSLVPWYVRVLVLVLFSLLIWYLPFAAGPAIVQISVLTFLWIVGLVTLGLTRVLDRRGRAVLTGVTFGLVMGAFLALVVAAFLYHSLVILVSSYLLGALFVLAPILFQSGTSYADIAVKVVSGIMAVLTRHGQARWLAVLLTALLAVGMLIYALWQLVPPRPSLSWVVPVVWLLAPAVPLVALLAAVAHWTRVSQAPDRPVSMWAPFWAGTTSFGAVALATLIVIGSSGATRQALNTLPTVWLLLLASVLLLLGVFGFIRALLRRQHPGGATVTGLFFCVLAMEVVYGALVIVTTGWYPSSALATAAHDTLLGFHALQLVVAATTLAYLVIMLVRHGLSAAITSPATALFLLNGSLPIIIALYAYLSSGSREPNASLIAGAAVAGSLLWNLLISSRRYTTDDSDQAPRAARVLLYAGYVMLLASAVLYFAALGVHDTGAGIAPFVPFILDGVVIGGLYLLGPAWLITEAVRRFVASD